MERQRSTFWASVLALAAGMGGELHVAVPGFGFMAMYDVVAYVVAVPIILLNWNRMGRNMRKFLLWSFAWTAAAMLANLFHFVQTRYWFKCVSLASSSWAIIAASYVLLRNNPKGYLWYLVGAGLGGWIALYHFRNGSLEAFAMGNSQLDVGSSTENLIEKQVYPSIARGILFACVLPFLIWWKEIPVFLILCATMFAGFYLLLHGGSRSNFGMFCAAACVGYVVAYGTKQFRLLAQKPAVMAFVVIAGGSLLFGTYKMMASTGQMGEGEKQKLEDEFGEGRSGALMGRAGFGGAVKDAMSSCGIGLGGHLRRHSVMSNALSCEGIVGFSFWMFFYAQCFWFLCHRIPYAGKYAAFIFLMVLTAGWDVFGSPFGTRHKFFMLMAFIALCRDNRYYGPGTIFDPKMVGARQWWSSAQMPRIR